jgi:hypothetical protein
MIESGVYRALLVRLAPETGIEEGPVGAGLTMGSVSPNPSSDMANLSWVSGNSGISEVSVYDLSGRLWTEQDLGVIPEGEHSFQLDTQQLPPGCYLVVVSNGSERAATKLVKLP